MAFRPISKAYMQIMIFLSLHIDFVLANSADPDEMPPYWVFLVCQSTCLGVPSLKRVEAWTKHYACI